MGGADLVSQPEIDERFGVRGLGAQSQFGKSCGECGDGVAGNGAAPLDRPVAVAVRDIPGRSLLCLKRNADGQRGVWALGVYARRRQQP